MNSEQMVYILDDDVGVRKSLGWMLETCGYAFEAFSTPVEFLNEVKVGCPSCLLLDMNMPGMKGNAVLREITRQPKLCMPVIILTGSGNVAAAVECIKLGALDFLEKPVDHEVLLARLRYALASDAARREKDSETASLRRRVALLTDREREVLNFLCEGKSTKEMASRLSISTKTVSIHRWHLMKKMQVGSATEAVRLAHDAHAA